MICNILLRLPLCEYLERYPPYIHILEKSSLIIYRFVL